MTKGKPNTIEGIISQIVVDPSGCWLRSGRVQRSGYAQTCIGGRGVFVHRLSYEYFIGPIPRGLELDHLCRIKHCCNPGHLEAVTHQENVARGLSNVESRLKILGAVRFCEYGHEMVGDNVYSGRYGIPYCVTCRMKGMLGGL